MALFCPSSWLGSILNRTVLSLYLLDVLVPFSSKYSCLLFNYNIYFSIAVFLTFYWSKSSLSSKFSFFISYIRFSKWSFIFLCPLFNCFLILISYSIYSLSFSGYNLNNLRWRFSTYRINYLPFLTNYS